MKRNLAGRAADTTYDDLYAEHRGRVVRLCRLLLRDPHEAEEAEQEVFLAVFRRLGATADEITWPAWITRVTVNACRDRRRSGWWRLWRVASDELDESTLAAGEDPEHAALGAECRGRIGRAWRRLPARQREVFLLRQVEGLSTEETAAALGVAVGSVKRHLFRAVLNLRAALQEEES